MRIARNTLSPDRRSALQADIVSACAPGMEGRVCGPQCSVKCPDCGSTACQCMCSQACDNVTRMLSSEPDRFPIETGIAPLVFELKRTGFFTPCWSCEGHLGTTGELWKLPQVWFYCASAVHLRLLAEMLKALEFDKRISNAWVIAVTHSDPGNPETTYAVQPRLPDQREASLAELQADARAIATALPDAFSAVAGRLRSTVDGTPSR